MNRIEDSWRDIEKAVETHRPALTRAFAKPAPAAVIKLLERTLGQRLPRDLVESLRIHDGVRDVARSDGLFDGQKLLSAREIASTWRVMKRNIDDGSFDPPSRASRGEVQNCHWSAGWIPITDSNGDGFCIDLDPGPRGKRGQVIYFYNYESRPVRVVAPNYAKWLASIPRRIASEARRERRMQAALPSPSGNARERKRIETRNTEMPFLLAFIKDLPKSRDATSYRPIARIPVPELLSYAVEAGLLAQARGRYRLSPSGKRHLATAFG